MHLCIWLDTGHTGTVLSTLPNHHLPFFWTRLSTLPVLRAGWSTWVSLSFHCFHNQADPILPLLWQRRSFNPSIRPLSSSYFLLCLQCCFTMISSYSLNRNLACLFNWIVKFFNQKIVLLVLWLQICVCFEWFASRLSLYPTKLVFSECVSADYGCLQYSTQHVRLAWYPQVE